MLQLFVFELLFLIIITKNYNAHKKTKYKKKRQKINKKK